MELKHDFSVPLPADQAWQVLLDVERVAPCMPGAYVDAVENDTVQGRVKVKLGAAMITYQGTAEFVERDESARRMVLDAKGKETRGPGTASATVTSTLHEESGGTRVEVNTDLKITGKPAQFGRGVMKDVGDKLLGQFAACLADMLSAESAST
ncbi:MAG: SRPBCC family protein [Streptosporangiaceae bacterium]